MKRLWNRLPLRAQSILFVAPLGAYATATMYTNNWLAWLGAFLAIAYYTRGSRHINEAHEAAQQFRAVIDADQARRDAWAADRPTYLEIQDGMERAWEQAHTAVMAGNWEGFVTNAQWAEDCRRACAEILAPHLTD